MTACRHTAEACIREGRGIDRISSSTNAPAHPRGLCSVGLLFPYQPSATSVEAAGDCHTPAQHVLATDPIKGHKPGCCRRFTDMIVGASVQSWEVFANVDNRTLRGKG